MRQLARAQQRPGSENENAWGFSSFGPGNSGPYEVNTAERTLIRVRTTIVTDTQLGREFSGWCNNMLDSNQADCFVSGDWCAEPWERGATDAAPSAIREKKSMKRREFFKSATVATIGAAAAGALATP